MQITVKEKKNKITGVQISPDFTLWDQWLTRNEDKKIELS